MAVADKASFFSRFTMKFVEVVGAGIATAITGYLIAHFGAFSFAPAPAAMPVAPAVSTITKGPRAQPVSLPGAAEPAAHTAPEPPPAPAAQPAHATVTPAPVAATEIDAAGPHAAKPARKPAAAEPRATESKPADKDDTASVEDQVRAALAKVDATRPHAPEPAPHPPEMTPPAPVAVAPPVQPAPAAPPPLGTVEIKSQPVATVDAAPPAAEPPAPDSAQADDKGILSTIKKIPDMLRPASGATSTPPRPPLPVGQ
jgi:hypothetical protein